jgi:hypothetical protein
MIHTLKSEGLTRFYGAGYGITSVNFAGFVLDNVVYIDLGDNALTEAAVNYILATLDGTDVEGGTLELDGGTNAAPTGQGLTDKASLISKGWTVTTN